MRDFGNLGGFESIFGSGRRQDPRRGQDVRVTVKLSLAEVASGVKKTVKLKTLERCATCAGSGAKPGTQPSRCTTCGGSGEVRRAARSMFGQFVSVSACPTCGGEGQVVLQPCEVCRGEGRVKGERTATVEIPAGVSSNNYLTLRGQGAAGPRNGPAGDLLVMLEVKQDDRFERRGRGRFSWFGRPAGDPQGSVILVVRDGRLTGSVMMTGAWSLVPNSLRATVVSRW